ncbi:MAG: DUF559 domain-containing protein [Anaerolineales bacterium]|nr:DUF559 domain-containing protein [Chloroflexota bacterium]MBL6980100.1 DUF559 domain-containing protein [Anaerolineales bacterium]
MTSEKRHRIHPIKLKQAKRLRQPQTPAEEKLWQAIRNRNLGGFKFRRQHPIGRFIVDFYCAAAKLVIEIDGDIHAFQAEYDEIRTKWLEDQGYTIIRFENRDVFENLDCVAQALLEKCQGE